MCNFKNSVTAFKVCSINFSQVANSLESYAIPTKMLETLNVLESGDRVEELHPHRTQDWPPVKEEQIAATA